MTNLGDYVNDKLEINNQTPAGKGVFAKKRIIKGELLMAA